MPQAWETLLYNKFTEMLLPSSASANDYVTPINGQCTDLDKIKKACDLG